MVYSELLMAIFYACFSGFLIGLNGLIMRYFVKQVGYTALQLNIDSFMLCGIYLFTRQVLSNNEFTTWDYAEGVLSALLSMGGVVSLTKAFNCGKGGPIQAIDSLKSLIPLFLNLFIRNVVPSWL